jgi:hypothetical protein
LRTPGCTTRQTVIGVDISRILLKRASERITPSASGSAPPDKPGAGAARDDRNLMFAADPQHRHCACSSVSGRHTASGTWR